MWEKPFIVTHSQRDAAYAHRIIRLLDGKIIAENRNRPMAVSYTHLDVYKRQTVCLDSK